MDVSKLSLGAIFLGSLALMFFVSMLITVAAVVWADPNPTNPKVKVASRASKTASSQCPQCDGGCPVNRTLPREYALHFSLSQAADSVVLPDDSRYVAYSLQLANNSVAVCVYDRRNGTLTDFDGVYDESDGTFTFPVLSQYNATLDAQLGVVTVTGGGALAGPDGGPEPSPPELPQIPENWFSTNVFSAWTPHSTGNLPGSAQDMLDVDARLNAKCVRAYSWEETREVPFITFTNTPAEEEEVAAGYVELGNGHFLWCDVGKNDSVAASGKLAALQDEGVWVGEGNDVVDPTNSMQLALSPATMTARYRRLINGQQYTNVGFAYSSFARFLYELFQWEDYNLPPVV